MGVIEIVRDEWGVARIAATTELAALYAQGYVQAQDCLATMFKAWRKAVGKMAVVFGETWVEHDAKQALFRHEAVAKAAYEQLPAFYQAALGAFLAGVRRFMADYPEHVPSHAFEVAPYHVLALSRAAKWDFIIKQAYHDLGTVTGESIESGIGSNAWAISPQRSAEGCVFLVSDPHVLWRDEWILHECHLAGGDLNVYGFQLPGLPYIQFGHNARAAWGITSGAADVCDVYELTLDETQERYLYEGEWRDLRLESVEIAVNLGDGEQESRTFMYRYSHHGAVLHQIDDKAYAVRVAYDGVVYDDLMALAALNKASSVGMVREAFDTQRFGPFNFIVGDVTGDIYYSSVGCVPQRPAGFDWLEPVQGDKSATEWLGWHGHADLPQILNPAAGFLLHCNHVPTHVCPQSGLTSEHYPSDLLWGQRPVFEDGNTARGRYLGRRLHEYSTMTRDEALDLLMDCTMDGAAVWLSALFEAFDKHGGDDNSAAAIQVLKAWDRQAKQDRVGMSLFWEWFLSLPDEDVLIPLWNRLLAGEKLDDESQIELLDALDTAVGYLLETWGRLEVAWGEVHQAKRGKLRWAVDGSIGLTLRVVAGAWEMDEDNLYTPSFGQACPMLVILKAGAVESYSALPFGVSDRPSSPHFADQGQKLFAQGILKNTCFGKSYPENKVGTRQYLDFDQED